MPPTKIIVAALSVRPSHICFQAITLLFVVGLEYCLAQMILGSLPPRSRSQGNLELESFPGHIIVVYGGIQILFGTISVFTFVHIFHPLIVIFRGASIASTDILVCIGIIRFRTTHHSPCSIQKGFRYRGRGVQRCFTVVVSHFNDKCQEIAYFFS